MEPYMNPHEIKMRYKNAKNKAGMMKILAELNGCSIGKVVEIVSPKKCKRKKDERMLLYEKGLNDVEIGKIVGVGKTAICNWRKRQGLEANQLGRPKKGYAIKNKNRASGAET